VLFLATRLPGPDWNPSEPMDRQAGWQAHAEFMNALVAKGFIVLGGPVGDGRRFVHACEAGSADEVRALFAADPWRSNMLELASVEPWEIVLRHDAAGP
jgi:uncharacterized protein YciI